MRKLTYKIIEETTYHQFKNEKFYVPQHEIEYLFVGTFNPEFGKKIAYYYGRKTNNFWKIISQIFKHEINPDKKSFFNQLTEFKIGCVDLVDSVTYEKEKYHNLINGRGYLDKVLFQKKNNIKKNYNTEKIIELIKKNNLKKIYITNQGGDFIKEQKEEIKLIEKFCNVVYLYSPSQIYVNRVGIEKVINNWRDYL